MSLDACAAIVERGDPDRFLAVMAAPRWAREFLFPLYAFNVEIARIPWLTSEPVIAEMRLQWWRDVIAHVASGAAQAHEVAAPLHALIRDAGLPCDVLDRLVLARRHDAWGEPFEDEAALSAYLEDTGAALMWLAARALGAPDSAEATVRAYGWAGGLANYLRAVAELTARGRAPLPDASPGALVALARHGLSRLAEARAGRARLPRAAAPALLAGWQAHGLLRLVERRPVLVTDGTLALSEFSRRGGLLWQALAGRW